MQPIRQGDVWLYPIEDEAQRDQLPKMGISRLWVELQLDPNDKDVLLALGEVTGHAHRIKRRPGRVRFREQRSPITARRLNDPRRILQVRGEPALLTHEEHETLAIPPGDYEVRIQREYVPGPQQKFVYVRD